VKRGRLLEEVKRGLMHFTITVRKPAGDGKADSSEGVILVY
jgi:hypothetical protein